MDDFENFLNKQIKKFNTKLNNTSPFEQQILECFSDYSIKNCNPSSHNLKRDTSIIAIININIIEIVY